MISIHVRTPNEALTEITQKMFVLGKQSSPRGQHTLEICNATILIEEPWQIPLTIRNRNLRNFIGAIEALQLVGQTSKPEQLIDNVKTFEQFADNGIFHGAYGVRIFGMLQPIIDLLKYDPDSRQAILTIYNSQADLNVQAKDIPCTLTIQFMIRDNKLCARTSMRSNDIWLGLPYDLIQFIALQGAIAKALSISMGWYCHTVGSLHLYESNIDDAKRIRLSEPAIKKPYQALWSGNTIEEISRQARKILDNKNSLTDTEATAFEHYLNNAIHEKDN